MPLIEGSLRTFIKWSSSNGDGGWIAVELLPPFRCILEDAAIVMELIETKTRANDTSNNGDGGWIVVELLPREGCSCKPENAAIVMQ